MRTQSIIGIAGAAGAVLALGMWIGSSRDTTARTAWREGADEPPTAVERAVERAPNRAARAGRPALQRPIAPGLAEDLRDSDPRVRRNAIVDLAASGNADPRTLVEATRDPDLDVAVAATEALGVLYRDGQIPASELVARLDGGAPPKLRVATINALGVVGSPDSARALTDLLARGSDIDRRSAAIVLVHQDPQLAVPALIAALRDSDENVRMNAREALRTIARGRDLGEDPAAWQAWWQSRSR